MIRIARVTEVTKMTLMNRVNLGTRMSWFKDDYRVTLLTRLTGMTGISRMTSDDYHD